MGNVPRQADRTFWIYALATAGTLSAFWLAIFYPGNLSPDSLSQWGQAVSLLKLEDWHPIGMTLLMRAVHVVFGWLTMESQIAVFAWIQGTVFWASIYSIIGIADLSRKAKLIACACITLYYPIWLYTVTLWKDVWFAVAFFWMIRCLYRFSLGEVSTSRATCSLVPLLVFAILNRHTTALSFLFLVAALSPIVWKRFGRKRLVANWLFSTVILLSAIGAAKLVNWTLDVADAGNITNWIALFEVAGTAHFAQMNPAEWRDLRSAQAFGEDRFSKVLRLYHCGATLDYLVFQPGHPLEKNDLLQSRMAIPDLFTVARNHPWAYLMHRGCSVLRLVGFQHDGVYFPFHEVISPNEFGLEARSVVPKVRAILMRWEHQSTKYPIIRWPYRHYLLLLASAVAAFLSLKRRTDPNRYLIYLLFVAGLAVLCPLCIVTPAPDWRYLMGADVCWVCSVLIPFVGRVGENSQLSDRSFP
jgi:hypothetical protein